MLLAQTVNVFRIWDQNLKEFADVAREVMHKRKELLGGHMYPYQVAGAGEIFEGVKKAA